MKKKALIVVILAVLLGSPVMAVDFSYETRQTCAGTVKLEDLEFLAKIAETKNNDLFWKAMMVGLRIGAVRIVDAGTKVAVLERNKTMQTSLIIELNAESDASPVWIPDIMLRRMSWSR